jgi:hypothetical protein
MITVRKKKKSWSLKVKHLDKLFVIAALVGSSIVYEPATDGISIGNHHPPEYLA